jgi:hypothetical protein
MRRVGYVEMQVAHDLDHTSVDVMYVGYRVLWGGRKARYQGRQRAEAQEQDGKKRE